MTPTNEKLKATRDRLEASIKQDYENGEETVIVMDSYLTCEDINTILTLLDQAINAPDLETIKLRASISIFPDENDISKRDVAVISAVIDHLAPRIVRDEWQPIDIKPEEEQIVLVAWPDGFILMAKYLSGDFWFQGNGKHMVNKIGYTHWMPLPQPPAQKGD